MLEHQRFGRAQRAKQIVRLTAPKLKKTVWGSFTQDDTVKVMMWWNQVALQGRPIGSLIVARFATGFGLELQIADDDGFIQGLGHVVDGEGGDRGGGERFHLDAGLSSGGGGGDDADATVCDVGLHVDMRKRKWVAHGNELGGALGGLDSSEARDFEGIALWILR